MSAQIEGVMPPLSGFGITRIAIPRPGENVRVKFDPSKPEDVIVV